MPFWDLLKDFADQGLSRFDTARALGYRPDSFCTLLTAHPLKDPFELSNKPLAYLLDTGEPFGVAVKRMAAEGMTITEAALAIGYKGPRGLRHAIEARGIVVEFRRLTRVPKIKRKPELNVTTGWPTWEKIYTICKVDTGVT